MAHPAGEILLADIGATNARFTLLDPSGEIGPVQTLAVADHPRFTDAVAAFLAARAAPPRDRKSTRLNSSHVSESRMPSSA